MIAWSRIEAALPTLQPSSQGYSTATRGVVTLADGTRCFVKIGTDERTKAWARHEVAIYQWLERAGYPHAVRLLAVSDDGFAIPDMSSLDFSRQWTVSKLDCVLQAMDDLAGLKPDAHVVLPRLDILNGWQAMLDQPEVMQQVLTLFPLQGMALTAEDVVANARKTKDAEQGTAIVHADVRGDNVAYDKAANRCYIVDWNWCAVGGREVDWAAFLVDVQRGGVDVRAHCPQRLSQTATLFMAGFWLYYCVQPIWEGGDPSLRDHQKTSGLVSLKWSRGIWDS